MYKESQHMKFLLQKREATSTINRSLHELVSAASGRFALALVRAETCTVTPQEFTSKGY